MALSEFEPKGVFFAKDSSGSSDRTETPIYDQVVADLDEKRDNFLRMLDDVGAAIDRGEVSKYSQGE